MSCSEARLLANQANARKSTGPTSAAGKARSRANALKHGLTGAAVAVPGEDVAEIERRFEAITDELNPQGELSFILTRRIAAFSVRLERSVRHEAAVLAEKVRHAGEAFDDARTDEADHLIGWVAAEPATFRRKLERTPEGVDRLISALRGLRVDLLHGGTIGDGTAALSRWSTFHGQKFDEYIGRRFTDYPASRCYALTMAMSGTNDHLYAGEGAGLEPLALRAWARDQMAALIDEQVTILQTHRESIDQDVIAVDRAEAGDRALFDATPAGVLARKYEAATERQLFRTLRELRLIQRGELAPPADPPVMPDREPVAPADLAIVAGQTGVSPLGSFFPGAPAASPGVSRAPRGAAVLPRSHPIGTPMRPSSQKSRPAPASSPPVGFNRASPTR